MTKEYLPISIQFQDESTLWAVQEQTVKNAFNFWNDFLALRQGDNNDIAIDDTSKSRFLCIIRAVSWVESKHGSAGANQPQKDPMQVGNPGDDGWKQFSGQIVKKDRIIRGPKVTPNYYADELPDAVKTVTGFPKEARVDKLTDKKKGHVDPNYDSIISYYWGIMFLIHKINTESSISDGKTYKCGDCSIERMKKGAVAYNGGGDPQYRTKIEEALALIKCME